MTKLITHPICPRLITPQRQQAADKNRRTQEKRRVKKRQGKEKEKKNEVDGWLDNMAATVKADTS